jgi:hypothetical protein
VASLIAVGVVASLDMILWITWLMSIAGPAPFSGVQEALLDYQVIRQLRRVVLPTSNPDLSRTERTELLVALFVWQLRAR